jgi:glycosyltransferase involved in cell wall biosynthesis
MAQLTCAPTDTEAVELGGGLHAAPPRLTLVIPTRNEKDSVPLLLAGLAPALTGLDAELLFVDDSDDETPRVLANLAPGYPVPVRLLHRPPGARGGGLSGAVVAGARHAKGGWVLVMDADLQHPPEAAAVLANTAMRHDCDIVVGTRYASHQSAAEGLGSAGRVFVSSHATWLVKNLFPRRLAMVSDPLSGLFAFRRSSVNLDRLRPTGFKVLLEILVRNPVARVAEVAYRFEPRAAGDSKASLRQGVAFLQHVVRLRAARLAKQLRERPVTRSERASQALRFVLFGLVGATGIVVNSAALWFFFHTLGWNHLLGASLATQVELRAGGYRDLPQARPRHPPRAGGPVLHHEQHPPAGPPPGFPAPDRPGPARPDRERHHPGAPVRRPVRAERPGHLRVGQAGSTP